MLDLKSNLEKTYTRKQTAELLHVSLPTLWSYSKKGIIKSVNFGNRVLYTESAILKVLEGK